MSMKLGKSDIGLGLLWLSIFRFYVPNSQHYYIVQGIISILLFFMFVAELRKIEYIGWICLFAGAVVASCGMNLSEIGMSETLKGIAHALTIINSFTVVSYYIRGRGTQQLFKAGLLFSGIYTAINMVQVLYGCLADTIGTLVQNASFFSIGKFSVAYVLLVFLAFLKFATRKLRGQLKIVANVAFFCIALLSIWACKAIDCSTGMVAIGIFTLFLCMPAKFIRKLDNKYIMLIVMSAALVIIFMIGVILSLPVVQHIIIEVLGEDLTLTGRVELYSLLLPLLKETGVFGNGFGSYATTRLGYGGWYNAQNGLSEIILTYGYFGFVAFLVMVFKCAECRMRHVKEWTALIYTFIAISLIEIPYNTVFVFVLAVYTFAGKSVRDTDRR